MNFLPFKVKQNAIDEQFTSLQPSSLSSIKEFLLFTNIMFTNSLFCLWTVACGTLIDYSFVVEAIEK